MGTGLLLRYSFFHLLIVTIEVNGNSNNSSSRFLHPEDPDILIGEYNFDDDFFTLVEPNIPACDFPVTDHIIKIIKNFEPFVDNFKFAHFNARSVPKSIDELNFILSQLKLDVFAISESWLSKDLPSELFEIEGYQIFRNDRKTKRGGGVCIYVKEYLKAKLINIPHILEQPEVIFIELCNKHTKFALGVVYKPPNIPYGTFACLQETFADILCKYENTFVFGDFNVDMLDPESYATKFLINNIIDPFDQSQIVSKPTRVTENSSELLDLMLVSNTWCI